MDNMIPMFENDVKIYGIKTFSLTFYLMLCLRMM